MKSIKKMLKKNKKMHMLEIKRTPNCKLCEWGYADALSALSGDLHKCSAQGYKLCINVYNNPECNELYSNKDSKLYLEPINLKEQRND